MVRVLRTIRKARARGMVPRKRTYAKLYKRTFLRSIIRGVHAFKRTVSCGPEQANANITLTNTANGVISFPSASGGMMLYTVNGGAMGLAYASIGYKFSILAVPGLTDFTALFDSYRIKKVVIKITPYANSVGTTFSGAPNTSADASGMFHYAIDKDDDTNPAASEIGIQDLQQRIGYKKVRLVSSKTTTITVKPRFAQSAYASAVSTGYTQGDPDAWIDLAYTSLPHYGLIGIFEGYTPNATAAVLPLRIETDYYLEFKTPR